MTSNATLNEPLAIPSNIAEVTIPLLIGTLLDYFLFGLLTLQTFVFYTSFPDDRLYIKILVYGSYFIEVVQACCAAANIIYWFGVGFGNMNHLENLYLSPFDTPLIGSIIAFIVQMFFCYRIWVLQINKRKHLAYITCGLIALISVFQLVGGIGCASMAHKGGNFVYISSSHSALIFEFIWLFGEALADVLIVGTMTYLLLGTSSEDIFLGHSTFATRIVLLIIHTNGLTASFAVISLVLRTTCRGKIYFVLPTFVLGKLYSNTLLATLNHRLLLRKNQHSENGREVQTTILVSKTVERVSIQNHSPTPSTEKKMSPQPQPEFRSNDQRDEEALYITPYTNPRWSRASETPETPETS